MPRYFVHIDDGSPMPGPEGLEFAGLDEVETAVRLTLVEMTIDAALERRGFSIMVEVRDEAGLLVMGGQVDYTLSLTPTLAYANARSHR